MTVTTLFRPRRVEAPSLDHYLDAAVPVLEAIRTNVFVASLGLELVYANSKAHETLRAMESEITSTFGVRLADVLGGSIHRFHRDPGRVEKILQEPGRLPHSATFSFGKIALTTHINALEASDGTKIGYIVAWEDSSSLLRSSQAVTSLTEQLSTAASTVEELGASIQEISRSAASAALMTDETAQGAEHTKVLMQTLSAVGNEVANITDTISSVAEQTNLLALNATIEAARAGEAGLGFAVVAREVKALAVDTADATQRIAQQIGSMRQSIDSVQAASDKIAVGISQVAEFQQTIASAVEEQAVASQELSGTIARAAMYSENAQRDIRL